MAGRERARRKGRSRVLKRDGYGCWPVALSPQQARERIEALSAKLALAADQSADDLLTGEQLQRITARVRPEVEAEQAKLRWG